MNKVELVSMVRNNRPDDLKEWVDYYFAIGFDKITIFDNESTFSVKELFSNYKNIDVREIIIDDLLDRVLPPTYEAIGKEKEDEKNYIAFLDDDEYIYIKNNKNIKDILNNEMEVLCLFWKYLSSYELLEDRETTIIDTFNYTTAYNPERNDKMQVKSIVNFNKCKDVKWGLDGPHLPIVNNSITTITGGIIRNGYGYEPMTINFYDNQEMYIYHYLFQTHRDWLFKRERRPHASDIFYNRPGNYTVLDNNMIDKKRELKI
jgi:hypothetical protein